MFLFLFFGFFFFFGGGGGYGLLWRENLDIACIYDNYREFIASTLSSFMINGRLIKSIMSIHIGKEISPGGVNILIRDEAC